MWIAYQEFGSTPEIEYLTEMKFSNLETLEDVLWEFQPRQIRVIASEITLKQLKKEFPNIKFIEIPGE